MGFSMFSSNPTLGGPVGGTMTNMAGSFAAPQTYEAGTPEHAQLAAVTYPQKNPGLNVYQKPTYVAGMGGTMTDMGGNFGSMRANTAEETARLRGTPSPLVNGGNFSKTMGQSYAPGAGRGTIGLGIKYGLDPKRTEVTGGDFYQKMANNQSGGVRPGTLPTMNAVQAARAGMGGTQMPTIQGPPGAALSGYMSPPRK